MAHVQEHALLYFVQEWHVFPLDELHHHLMQAQLFQDLLCNLLIAHLTPSEIVEDKCNVCSFSSITPPWACMSSFIKGIQVATCTSVVLTCK